MRPSPFPSFPTLQSLGLAGQVRAETFRLFAVQRALSMLHLHPRVHMFCLGRHASLQRAWRVWAGSLVLSSWPGSVAPAVGQVPSYLQAVPGAYLCSGLEAQHGTQRAACREPQRLHETCVPVGIIIAWLALLPPPALPCRLLRRGVCAGPELLSIGMFTLSACCSVGTPEGEAASGTRARDLTGSSACPAARGFDVMCTIFTQRASFHLTAWLAPGLAGETCKDWCKDVMALPVSWPTNAP